MNYVCRLCKKPLPSTHEVADAKKGDFLKIAHCPSCGLTQQADIPDSESLEIYYSHHYREDYKSVHSPKIKYVYRAGIAARDRIERFKKAGIHPKQHPRLLDIGAGGGEFCYVASRFGYLAKGVEPHLGYSEFARNAYGIEVTTTEIGKISESEKYDLITLFHVLEHLAEPLVVFKKLWTLLTDNGLLMIEVPNILQADASPHNIYFKAHLFYYCRFTLISAASRYFEPIWTEDEGNLTVIFRRRSNVLPQLIPSTAEELRTIQTRLTQKGWVEYLTTGKGYMKPLRRLLRILAEKKVRDLPPKEALEFAISEK